MNTPQKFLLAVTSLFVSSFAATEGATLTQEQQRWENERRDSEWEGGRSQGWREQDPWERDRWRMEREPQQRRQLSPLEESELTREKRRLQQEVARIEDGPYESPQRLQELNRQLERDLQILDREAQFDNPWELRDRTQQMAWALR